MSISNALREYLEFIGVNYKLLPHPHTTSSSRTAAAAHIRGHQIIKSILLKDNLGYLLAAIPATHLLDLDALEERLDRHLILAAEKELTDIFFDCELGAIPPLGEAYGILVIYDDALSKNRDVYFEAGDHMDLVHIAGDDFLSLMECCEHGRISHHP